MVQRPMRQVARPAATDRTADGLSTDYRRHDVIGATQDDRLWRVVFRIVVVYPRGFGVNPQ